MLLFKVWFLRELRLDSPWVTLISSNNFVNENIYFSNKFFCHIFLKRKIMHFLLTYLPTYLLTEVTVVTIMTVGTVVTVVSTKITQSLHTKKITQPLNCFISFFFSFFLSIFGKSNLTNLTTNMMFSGQRFVILAIF